MEIEPSKNNKIMRTIYYKFPGGGIFNETPIGLNFFTLIDINLS